MVCKNIIYAACLVLLAGCVQYQQQQNINAASSQFDAGEKYCQNKYNGVKQNTSRQECIHDEARQIVNAYNFPNTDLMELYFAKQIITAQKQDSGLISKEQANLENAQAKTEMAQAAQARKASANAAMVNQQAAANNQLIMGLGLLGNATSPAPVSPSMHCTTRYFNGQQLTDCY